MLKRFILMTALVAAGAQAAEKLPFVGQQFEYRYGDFAALERFESDTEMTFTITAGKTTGLSERVKYQAREVAPDTYLISWQEADGGTVVHVDNFKQGTSHSLYTTAQKQFYVNQGTVRPAK